jgi:hypothetical protein
MSYNFMRYLLLILTLLPISVMAQTVKPQCNVAAGEYQQKQAGYATIYSKCGAELQKEGWAISAECNNGHQWFYVLRLQKYDEKILGYKDVKPKMFCEGINALAGSEETPCVPLNAENNKIFKNCIKENIAEK